MKNTETTFPIVCALLLSLMFGCASPKIATTQSGRPEVVIHTKNIDTIKSALISAFVNVGYVLGNDSQYRLTLTRQTSGMEAVGAQLAIGNQYSTTPVKTIGFTFANVSDGIRVIADMSMSTQMAFGQVNQADCSQGSAWFNEIQTMLEVLKGKLERGGPPKARLGVHFTELSAGTVKSTIPNTAAEKAGITKGCRLLSLNGKPYSVLSLESEVKSKNPGDKVTVEWRNTSGAKVVKEIVLEAYPSAK